MLGKQKLVSQLYVAIAVFAFSLMGIQGCGDNSGNLIIPTSPILNTSGQVSFVRVVHNSPDAPNVDVLVDDRGVLLDVPYLTSSTFLRVPSGERNFKVNATGTETSVIDDSYQLDPLQFYTVLAVNTLSNIEPLVITDDDTLPATGNIRIRVIHGAPNAGTVDVFVTAPGVSDLSSETPLLDNIDFKLVSDYAEVAEGTYRVRVTDPSDPSTVFIDSGATGITLADGSIKTFIAVEATGGGSPFGLNTLDDDENFDDI